MNPSKLTDPGPAFRGVRNEVAFAVGTANAHKSHYAGALKQMLLEAADAIDAEGGGGTGTPPSFLDGVNIGYVGEFTDYSPGGTLYTNDDSMPWTIINVGGDEPISFSYQWYTMEDPEDPHGEMVNIPGATGNTYTITNEDIGLAIGVRVTATNSAGKASFTSHSHQTVIDPSLAPNDPLGGTAIAGENPGEIIVSIEPGEQIPGFPDTGYEVSITSTDGQINQWFITDGADDILSGIASGTYNVQVDGATNSITTKWIQGGGIIIGTDIVVS